MINGRSPNNWMTAIAVLVVASNFAVAETKTVNGKRSSLPVKGRTFGYGVLGQRESRGVGQSRKIRTGYARQIVAAFPYHFLWDEGGQRDVFDDFMFGTAK